MQSRLKVKSDCQRSVMKGGGAGGVWRGEVVKDHNV